MSGIQYPIEVKEIGMDSEKSVYDPNGLTAKCGDMVMVRPCAEKFENKTYLGVFIGEVALQVGAQYNEESGKLTISRYMYNPMILIPEFNEVVWGCGSWWGKIKDESHLKQITDEDINNVWYVKALKQLQDQSPAEDAK